MSDETTRELLAELDNEWHTLKHGNPVPGLYLQTGAETVRVRGHSEVIEEQIVTNYEILVLDEGKVIGKYTVRAEELADEVEESYGE